MPAQRWGRIRRGTAGEAGADDVVGVAVEDRRDQALELLGGVLAVGVAEGDGDRTRARPPCGQPDAHGGAEAAVARRARRPRRRRPRPTAAVASVEPSSTTTQRTGWPRTVGRHPGDDAADRGRLVVGGEEEDDGGQPDADMFGHLYTIRAGIASLRRHAARDRRRSRSPPLRLLGRPACRVRRRRRRLTIYSGRTLDLIGPILEQFAEETGIDIDVRDGTTADLALQIDTEGDRSPADVFLSQSPGAVGFLDERGRLAPLPDDAPRRGAGRGPGRRRRLGRAHRPGAHARLQHRRSSTRPTCPARSSTSPTRATTGMLGVAPGNASFQDFVTGLRGELGDDETLEFLEGIAANDAPTYPNNVSILDAVNRGEIAMGLINHYYWFEATQDDPDQPSALHFFDDGDLGVDAARHRGARARHRRPARGRPAARRVPARGGGAAYFAEETLEYPLAAGVEPVEGLFPLDEIVSARVDFGDLGVPRPHHRADRRERPRTD